MILDDILASYKNKVELKQQVAEVEKAKSVFNFFSTDFQLSTEQAQKTKRLLKLMQTFNTLVDKFHTQGETKNAYSVILDSIKSIESQLKHLRSGIKDLNGIVSAYDGGTDDETLIYNIKKFGDGG